MNESAAQGCNVAEVQMRVINDISSSLAIDAKPLNILQWFFTGGVLTFIAEFILWILGILH